MQELGDQVSLLTDDLFESQAEWNSMKITCSPLFQHEWGLLIFLRGALIGECTTCRRVAFDKAKQARHLLLLLCYEDAQGKNDLELICAA